MARGPTHVLDTAHGKAAAGLGLSLLQGDRLISRSASNADGRSAEPLALKLRPGVYRIEFSLGDSFRPQGVESPFLERVPVEFCTTAGQSHHVPLAGTPWLSSTYRGS